jgi:N,N-dimethylformamidase
MSTSTRREFIKRSGVGVAGIATVRFNELASAAKANRPTPGPPHRPLLVQGIHAYADRQSVAAGESISFHVSSTVPYRLALCRLGPNVDEPNGDEVLQRFPEAQPRAQPIHPGSYVYVAQGLEKKLRALTLECWVRPWQNSGWAGLLTQFDFKRAGGFGLLINPGGGASFYLGDQTGGPKTWEPSTPDGQLKSGRWHHLVATWNGKNKVIWINGQPVASSAFAGVVPIDPAPLGLAAATDDGVADHFFDGDLAMAVVYDDALDAKQISERFQQNGLLPAKGTRVQGCWTFSEEQGERVADHSSQRRHGRIVNHATWMIGGPSFNADVPRFGNYSPRTDLRRGHGLRFASDDLYDCRWEPTHKARLPHDAKPGIYVGRIEYEWKAKPHLYDVTFIVKKARRRTKAPILVLTATNTWRAYSATPFAAAKSELKQVWGTNGSTNSPGNPPAYCFYRGHAASQGTYQLGLRTPWPAAGPYILYGGHTDYSHLCRADRFLHVWLEQAGYDFDVITDLDLHREPEILRRYQTFVINGHSEYWSIPMYRGLEKYLSGGGNVICLSGNTLFWRVSFSDDGAILECRKVDAPGEQLPHERRGECWHSQDGLRGGLLRECGYPGWKLTGLETLGWNNQDNPAQFGPYLVEQPDHFLFNHPEPVGLNKNEALGQGPDGKLPRANGHEIDVRLSTLAALQEKPAPDSAPWPNDPPGITRLANGIMTWKIGGSAFDYFFRPLKPKSDQGGEMIFWERPEGGRVFNAGSIGAGWALLADSKFQTLLRNVLFHFGVKRQNA